MVKKGTIDTSKSVQIMKVIRTTLTTRKNKDGVRKTVEQYWDLQGNFLCEVAGNEMDYLD